MRAKRYSAEQIVAELREAEKLQAQGLTIPQSCKRLGDQRPDLLPLADQVRRLEGGRGAAAEHAPWDHSRPRARAPNPCQQPLLDHQARICRLMNTLLRGELDPVTREIGFLAAPLEAAVAQFVEWQSGLRGSGGYTTRRVSGELRSLLCALEPLTSVQRERFLFVPTRSRWVAYLDNGHQGTDVFSVVSLLAEDLRCRGIRAVATPDGPRDKGGAVILELYGPTGEATLHTIRAVGVAKEGGRWDFWESGDRQPFEQPHRYEATRVRDRFTPEMLKEYLAKLDIELFDERFYAPQGEAILVERSGRRARGVEEFPLVGCHASAAR